MWLLVPDTLGPSLGHTAVGGGVLNPWEVHIHISFNNDAFTVQNITFRLLFSIFLCYLELELELDLFCRGPS